MNTQIKLNDPNHHSLRTINNLKLDIIKIENDVKKLEKDSQQKTYEHLKKFFFLVIVWEHLAIIEKHMFIFDILEKVEKKNKKNLNQVLKDTRKIFFNIIVYLEKVYGSKEINDRVDIKLLKLLEPFQINRIFIFISKIISYLKKFLDLHEQLPKYKWNMLDLYSRIIILIKQMVDPKPLQNPNHLSYIKTMELYLLLKNHIEIISEKFREKYFTATKKREDMLQAINYQLELKMIFQFLGKTIHIDPIQKKVDSWKQILLKEEKRKKMSR